MNEFKPKIEKVGFAGVGWDLCPAGPATDCRGPEANDSKLFALIRVVKPRAVFGFYKANRMHVTCELWASPARSYSTGV